VAFKTDPLSGSRIFRGIGSGRGLAQCDFDRNPERMPGYFLLGEFSERRGTTNNFGPCWRSPHHCNHRGPYWAPLVTLGEPRGVWMQKWKERVAEW